MAEQVASIFAGSTGVLDDLPVERVGEFEEAMLGHLRHEFPEVLEEISTTGVLSDDLREQLKKILGHFKTNFLKSEAGE